jgi:probable F420-dependent oxidoreductase
VKFWLGVAFLHPQEMLDMARVADGSGYHGIAVSDHVVYPEKLSTPYPYTSDGSPPFAPDTPWPDPWVLIGAMAAVTTRLRFMTNVYVAPARNPFLVAKQVSTAAVLSGDRVALGVGAGWMREEFAYLGQPFGDRGRRLDEMIDVLRALWRGGMVEHHGEHYDFDRLQMSPVPAAPIPIYCGGQSRRALERAARLDGWIGNAYTPEQALELVGRVRRTREDPAFEVIVSLLARPDADLYRRMEDGGVTGLLCAPWMRPGADDLAARRAAVERFADTVIAKL